MRIINADILKDRISGGDEHQDLITAILNWIDLQETVASCKTCVWRADHVLKVSGRENSLCPIEQHYVLPEDGFCHLYESDKKISDERIKGLVEGKK